MAVLFFTVCLLLRREWNGDEVKQATKQMSVYSRSDLSVNREAGGFIIFLRYCCVAMRCERCIKGLECFVLFVSVYVVCSGWAMA